MYPFDPSSPVSADFRDSVSARILSFLDDEKRVIDAIGAELSPVLDAARDYTAGGKRLQIGRATSELQSQVYISRMPSSA